MLAVNLQLSVSCNKLLSNTLATWYKEPTYLKKTLMLGKMRAEGEGDGRG